MPKSYKVWAKYILAKVSSNGFRFFNIITMKKHMLHLVFIFLKKIEEPVLILYTIKDVFNHKSKKVFVTSKSNSILELYTFGL